jgi:hypothetical protein
MEVVPYFLSIIVAVAALYWSAREYRRKPGTSISGLFRYQEALKSSLDRARLAKVKTTRANMAGIKAKAAQPALGPARTSPSSKILGR